MSHKLLTDNVVEKPRKKRFTMPNIEGKFGIALFVGGKEVFIGVVVGNVDIERITRQRMIKAPHAGVKVFRFD